MLEIRWDLFKGSVIVSRPPVVFACVLMHGDDDDEDEDEDDDEDEDVDDEDEDDVDDDDSGDDESWEAGVIRRVQSWLQLRYQTPYVFRLLVSGFTQW